MYVLRNWVMQAWEMASLKSVGQPNRLGILAGVDEAV